jgi:two-component sensor histidine kinase/ligand-binding sensor domain-containing protein
MVKPSLHILLLILCLLSFTQTGTAQSIIPFEPLGDYSWVKKNIITKPEKLNCTIHKRKATVRFEPKEKQELYQRQANFFIEHISHSFVLPETVQVKFTGKQLIPEKKIASSPFYYKDNALFDMVYADKAHGFLSNNVQAIAEDNEKNIWMATTEGLIRFDGYYYYLYNEKSGVVSGTVHVVNDPSTGVWVSSSNGFQLIRNDSVFDPVIKGIEVSGLDVNKVNVDKNQNIWINTVNHGALKLNRNLNSMQHFDTSCGLPANYVRCSVLDKSGQYWFAGNGITTIKDDSIAHWYSSKKYFNYDESLVLLEDADTMWVGTFDNCLFRISAADTTQISLAPNFGGRVFDLIKSDGALWFTLYGGGLVYMMGDDYCLLNETNGLSSNLAYSLMKDSYGNIWVSTPDAGMSRFNGSGLVPDFHAPSFLRNAEVIKTDNQGNRWYFLNGGGLWKETKIGYELVTNDAEKPVPSLRHFMDGILNADGTAWLASYSYGVAYYDKKHITFYYYADDPVKRVVLSAAVDKWNRTWFGTMHYGLIYVKESGFYHLTIADGLASNNIIKVARGMDGSILFLSESGIQKISNDTLYDLYVSKKPFVFTPSTLHITKSGEYLLASSKGLLMMKDSRMYSVSSTVSLEPSTVKSILEDSTGTLWLTHEMGISKARLQDLYLSDVYLLKAHNKNMLTRMDAAGYIDENNLPHWSSGIGMLSFKPSFETPGTPVPTIKIQGVYVDGVPVINNQSPEIYPENKLRVTYTVICWGNEHALRQRYLLIRSDNNDTLMSRSTEKGMINLQALPVGEYQLILTTELYQTTYHSKPLVIRVTPHWYNSNYFYVFCIGLLALAIDRLYWIRTKRLQKSKQILEDTVASRTADLQHALAEREMLLKEIHHRVKNNLQVISGLLELQTEEITDEKAKALFREGSNRVRSVALIHQNLYREEKLSGIFFRSFAADLSRQIADVYGDKQRVLNVEFLGEDPNLDIDTAVPLGLAINELLTNAYKYAITKPNPTIVKLELSESSKGHYKLIFRDNGPGIKGDVDFERAGTLGLRLVKGLMQQIAGSVTYKNDGGAMFIIYFKDTETRKKE